MDAIEPKFSVDADTNKPIVVLTLEQWQQVSEELEELADIRAYDEAKASNEETVPLEQAIREIESSQ